MMDMTEKQLSSQLIFDGKVVHLYKDDVALPGGVRSVREYIRHVGAVCVLPLTDEGEVLLDMEGAIRAFPRESIAKLTTVFRF